MSGATMVDIDFGGEFEPFFCPFCGHRIINPETIEAGSTPCQHVEFIYVDVAGEFDFVKTQLHPTVEKLMNDPEGDTWGILDSGNLKKMPDDMVIFGLTTSGMACGPVSSTVSVALRLNVGS